MNVALIGYGKMGREIEKLLVERGHSIVLIVDENSGAELNASNLQAKGADIAIEFSTPDTAYDNIRTCISAGIGVVCGTTGWLDRYEDVVALCSKEAGAFFYASNYSIGMNIFFRLNEMLAGMMNSFPDFEVNMEEVHHIHKKDAPSGTAITLAEGIIGNIQRKIGWKLGSDVAPNEISIVAERRGEVPGTHRVKWESDAEEISITHQAKNRAGLALGAVLAAEYLNGKTGVYSMNDLLGI